MAQDWIVELYREGHGFMTHAAGYETEAKAKAAPLDLSTATGRPWAVRLKRQLGVVVPKR